MDLNRPSDERTYVYFPMVIAPCRRSTTFAIVLGHPRHADRRKEGPQETAWKAGSDYRGCACPGEHRLTNAARSELREGRRCPWSCVQPRLGVSWLRAAPVAAYAAPGVWRPGRRPRPRCPRAPARRQSPVWGLRWGHIRQTRHDRPPRRPFPPYPSCRKSPPNPATPSRARCRADHRPRVSIPCGLRPEWPSSGWGSAWAGELGSDRSADRPATGPRPVPANPTS